MKHWLAPSRINVPQAQKTGFSHECTYYNLHQFLSIINRSILHRNNAQVAASSWISRETFDRLSFKSRPHRHLSPRYLLYLTPGQISELTRRQVEHEDMAQCDLRCRSLVQPGNVHT
ncbi:hypothetical protein CY34DRAFT_581002 [Suillus luteus UH-Slu-Lm8-n1]|uniref:Uncharacterized protein n=1 Tax=Suillus luteus UH-Slu-Lm8-n1 TaxID=930992 RepID=A0A0D0BGD1_9AGAM|nr:hypothetical protein CY34DRAFT_581002 [Suillus luteus UH-Slu-Lm8-n1]